MPAKNRIKTYVEGGYYHIYNRGVDKREIFLDEQDYGVFLSYLKEYLMPKNEIELHERLSDPNTSYKEKDKILKQLRLNNFAGEITLLAYCLMPNHFHFFIKQKSADSIDKFMQSICTRYTMYFNKKHKRVGFLYQDTYKGVLIKNEPQFIYLSKYIHKQALTTKGPTLRGWEQKQPSSFGEYIGERKGERKTPWVFPEEILSYFSKSNPSLSYQSFVLENSTEDEAIVLDKIMFESCVFSH